MKGNFFKKMMGFLVLFLLVSSLTGISATETIKISEQENGNGTFDVNNDQNLNNTLIYGTDLNDNGADLNYNLISGSDLDSSYYKWWHVTRDGKLRINFW